MEAELPWSYQCGDENPISYPVVLNPGSTARNFDATKQINYLYFTRFNYVNCLPTWDLATWSGSRSSSWGRVLTN